MERSAKRQIYFIRDSSTAKLYGWPNKIRTDGGPAYRNEFTNFCSSNGIKHELCSAYNPESNGLAEAGVKNMKSLVERCKERDENLEEAIAAWRNICLLYTSPSPRDS